MASHQFPVDEGSSTGFAGSGGKDPGDNSTSAQLQAARAAWPAWAACSLPERLDLVRRFRHLLAQEAEPLAARVQLPSRSSMAETLSAEILPLAEACRFLERQASRALVPRRLPSSGQPSWLRGVELEIGRDPFGVVLIVGPANYPIFLPGVQMLQALVAGNAVLLKPGRDGRDAARHMAGILQECGLDSRLLSILPESPAAAREAIQLGVDKVFLTGSADTGQAILQELGPKLTPAVLELSGCDAVFVQEDADLELVVKALSFGLRLNGGATCIAPRRVFVHQCQAAGLEQRLRETVHRLPPVWVDHRASELACRLAAAAVAEGARLLTGSLTLEERMRPLLLADARGSMALLQADLFAPVLTIVPVPDDEAALAEARLCPYALGAAVFGPVNPARALARRIRAGCVVINDMIVPTADPRLPFGGRGRSGFGVTRGLEGLREMTTVKVIAIRRSRWLPHLDQPREGDGELLRDYLAAVHGGSIALRVRAVARLIRVLWRRWVTV